MGIMADFTCPDGHTHERFVSMDTKEMECPDCDHIATKDFSCPTLKMDKNSWKEVRKFAKQREQHIKHERKQRA